MADRKVSVKLVAEVGPYKAGMVEAASATEKVQDKVEKLDRSITKIPPDAAKAGAAMRLLGADAGKVGLQLDDFGRRSTALGAVDQRIAMVRREVALLADTFNRTGDVSFLEHMFAGTRELRQLERLKTQLTSALGDGARKAVPVIEGALADAGQGASKGFWAAFQSLPPQAQAAIVAAIVAAIAAGSIYIGSVLGGALLAGVGAAGLGAAIAGQISNPAVANAIGTLKTDFTTMFKDATSPFEPVLIRAAGAFRQIVKEVAPSLKGAFEAAAPFAETFLQGVGDFVRSALPGLETALVAGSKILARLGESQLPRAGQAVSDFFDRVSKGGREGGDALGFLIDSFSFTLKVMGTGIGIAEMWYGKFEDVAGLVGGLATGNFALFTDRLQAMIEPGDNVATSIKKIDGAAVAATASTRELSDAFDKAFGSAMNVDQAATRFAADVWGLKGALDSHSKSIDLNSAAGAHNREVLQGAIADAKAHRDALIAQAGGANASKDAIDNANKVYQDDINKLRDMAIKANISARAFDDLAGQYNVDIVVHHTDIYSKDYQSYRSGERGNRWGGIYQHAQGGLLSADVYSPMSPARYAFAEPGTGGEAFVPRFGDYGRSTSILDQASRWYGGRFVPGGSGAVMVQQPVTVCLPTGEPIVKTIITYALNTGRTPAQLFPDSHR
jgi:hypothetical protein